jgi:YebC/PmpR family DNA-binding regulatory protein
MSGHSKRSTIKRKKGAADQKRGKIFTRCIHEISTAVKEGGGGDPEGNPRLRTAIDKAKGANMPNDTIDRAIRRATGEDKDTQSVDLNYEGYGPGGTAVLVEVTTDNKNRTVSEIRHAFTKCGGTLGEANCVSWMFDRKGLIVIRKELAGEEELMTAALDAGADDVADGDDVWELLTEPTSFYDVRTAIETKYQTEIAEVQMIPKTRIELTGKAAEQMMRMMEMLEDIDDVLNVYTNADFVE